MNLFYERNNRYLIAIREDVELTREEAIECCLLALMALTQVKKEPNYEKDEY